MINLEFENMVLGTNRVEERIEDQPIWDVRCWLEGLNENEFLKIIKDGQTYTNADELFTEILTHGDYEKSIQDGNILTIIYKNGDIIKLEGINCNTLKSAKKVVI